MTMQALKAFGAEAVMLVGALALFVVSLGREKTRAARRTALATAAAGIVTAALCIGEQAVLFDGAYRVDLFSQLLKLIFAVGLALVLLLSGHLPDIRGDVKAEYYLLVTLSVCGLMMLVSCIELVTLVVSLQLAALPLYLVVPLRRERAGQRSQMESAIKYLMFGVAANGVMLFGMSYLFGLTGTTHLPELVGRLEPISRSPLAVVGLTMTFGGLFYKLAVFPFHFWTPDLYQGASNETAGLVASLPKIGAVAVLVRMVSLASPDNATIAILLAILSAASMFYGNVIALVQKDFKRLLGFSAIAHAGYALIGFVALDQQGFAASLYYIVGYLFMVLACFVVACKVSADGANISLAELAGLHRRSPLLAVTLLVGVFGLAGIPPFVGFTGKLSLLTAAFAKGHVWLVIMAVVNSAIAVYYYLGIVREAFFGEGGDLRPIALNWETRVACTVLIAGTLLLGVAPARLLDALLVALAG